jgi:succinoglycan biosynthesis protein ExoA
MSNQCTLLTVVVPVHNEERYIARTIQYLLDQDYPHEKLEILVGVADSDDQTSKVVQSIAARERRVKFFHNPHGLSCGARTLGAQMAAGEIILYVDGHVYIDNDQLFRNTVRLMDEKDVSILSRPQFLDTPDNSFFQRAVSLARKSPVGHGPDSTIYSTEEMYVDPSSSGACYRREVFDRVGYFDLSFDACEDVEFNYRCARAGLRSFTSMKAAVYYYPRSSLRSLFQQMCRYGSGRFRLARKHPGTLLTAGMPLLGLLCFFWPFLLYPFLAASIAYVAALSLSSIVIARRHGWDYLPVLCLIYPAIHFGLGWGFIREILSLCPSSVGLSKLNRRGDKPAEKN